MHDRRPHNIGVAGIYITKWLGTPGNIGYRGILGQVIMQTVRSWIFMLICFNSGSDACLYINGLIVAILT